MNSCFDDGTPDQTKYRFASLVEVERFVSDAAQFRAVTPKTTRACWLPSAGLRTKMIVSLKGQEGLWYIEGISPMEVARYLLHTDWPVGGLGSYGHWESRK
jgi:hypothetical protein